MLDTGGGNTDWQDIFLKVIKNYPPKTIFEFGLGLGSLFLTSNCEKLVSYEVVVREEQKGWADFVKSQITKENYEVIVDEFPDTWNSEMCTRFTLLLEKYSPDIVFVDSGCHCRGEIVNLCIKIGINIIIAHDTNHGIDAYGWNLIDKKDYYKYQDTNMQGTTVWSRKPLDL